LPDSRIKRPIIFPGLFQDSATDIFEVDVHDSGTPFSDDLSVIGAGGISMSGVEQKPNLVSGRFAESIDLFSGLH
jgi:hypothetical protein